MLFLPIPSNHGVWSRFNFQLRLAHIRVGFKGGCGFRFFANLGLQDTRRVVRRSVDVMVDEVLSDVAGLVTDDVTLPPGISQDLARSLIFGIRAPVKMALRSGFELGLALAEDPQRFDPSQGQEMAKRCVQVVLEEAQRFLLEQLAKLGIELFKQGLGHIGIDEAKWENSAPLREQLGALLQAAPDEPFEPTGANATYWMNVANASVDLAVNLGGTSIPDDVLEPVAVTWSATQLLFASVQQISDVGVRAAIIGLPPAQTRASFTGDLLNGAVPPQAIKAYINTALARPAMTPINQDDLVEFLIRDAVLDALRNQYPEVDPFLDIVAGPQGIGATAAAQTLLSNLSAFVPDASGQLDAQRTLEALADGLRAYIDARVRAELVPIIYQAVGNRPDLRLYVDEVLLATLDFTIGVVYQKVIDWSANDLAGKSALREACSSIVMKLFGRSLVVTADVLLAHTMEQVGAEFADAAEHVGDPAGIATELARVTGFDEETVAEITEETLLIASDVFTPLPDATRKKIRELLYEAVDTMPADADADWLDNLRHDFFVPNLPVVVELAKELGGTLADYLLAFIVRVLWRIAELILEEIAELVADAEAQIHEWVDDLGALAIQLTERLVVLAEDIAGLGADLAASLADALEQTMALLATFSDNSNREQLRRGVRRAVLSPATGLLSGKSAYVFLPAAGRRLVRNSLSAAVDDVLDVVILDDIQEAVGDFSAEAEDFLEDVRALDPTDDLFEQITELFLDRVEDKIRAVLGYSNPVIPLEFAVEGSYTPPRVGTRWTGYYQPPDVELSLSIDLGDVSVPINELVLTIRSLVRALSGLDDLIEELAKGVQAAATAEHALEAAEIELAIAESQKAEVDTQMADHALGPAEVVVVEPTPTAVYQRDVQVELRLSGVPASFLGRGTLEQQRVFVWLNEAERALDVFDVEELQGSALPFVLHADATAAAGAITLASLLPTEHGARTPTRPSVEERSPPVGGRTARSKLPAAILPRRGDRAAHHDRLRQEPGRPHDGAVRAGQAPKRRRLPQGSPGGALDRHSARREGRANQISGRFCSDESPQDVDRTAACGRPDRRNLRDAFTTGPGAQIESRPHVAELGERQRGPAHARSPTTTFPPWRPRALPRSGASAAHDDHA